LIFANSALGRDEVDCSTPISRSSNRTPRCPYQVLETTPTTLIDTPLEQEITEDNMLFPDEPGRGVDGMDSWVNYSLGNDHSAFEHNMSLNFK
jgi:hypothetical protein